MPPMSEMKLGKLAPRHDARTLKMARYSAALPDPPAACDLTGKITDIGVMLNDQLGDCTCAAIGHMVQAWTAEGGNQVILPDADILAAYEAFCGYIPGDASTDEGGVEIDVLNGWRKTGVGGHKIGAYMALQVKPSVALASSPHAKVAGLWKWLTDLGEDVEGLVGRKKPASDIMLPELAKQLKQGVYFFGGVYIGVELPLTAQDQPEIWDYVSATGKGAPSSWGGHAVPIVAYDGTYFYVISWGKLMKMTPAFAAVYMSEAYVCLSVDIIEADGKSPEGFDLTQLQTNLSEVTS